MSQEIEILPAEAPAFELPPGIRAPENLLLFEDEAARFLREPEARLRARRFAGNGPVFVKPEDEPWAVRYFTWDLIRWACQHRRNEMPSTPRRGSRKGTSQEAA